MTSSDVSVGGGRGGRSRPSVQHGLSSDRPSAGRRAVPPRSSTQDESNDREPPVQPEVTTTDEVEDQVRGGDRRIARREPRESRVTARFSQGEAAQLARQGWAGVEPDVDDLRRATATFLALAKELSR